MPHTLLLFPGLQLEKLIVEDVYHDKDQNRGLFGDVQTGRRGSGGRACDKGTQDGEDYGIEDVQDEDEQNAVALCEEKEESERKDDGEGEEENSGGDGDEGEGDSVGKGGEEEVPPPGIWDIEDLEARPPWIGIPKQDNSLPSSAFE
ncbi:a4537853-0dfc-45a0-8406-f7125ae03e43 [Sclerotinia trifoliorum]|uniref:A4537853-0dfc-45a0-8406-f7125ae03e43 n=1 Tax=Sclerotinia trifoliorum TaxID=28548 RepID=A0A8H2VWY3_9HELO|nr:a4537853-0dfc-45a0-8406-f7125ae03e43 [Sclerotinia trifoliorum]